MPGHEKFTFQSSAELLEKSRSLGIDLPFQDSLAPLLQPLDFRTRTLSNRLAVHPMEGFDADSDGAPGELTLRRYPRFAEGGFGLIWFEATSVVPEGRSNPGQLMLTRKTARPFAHLVQRTRKANPDSYLVLQLTHSGRYSAPGGKPAPCLPKARDLDQLLLRFVEAAELAREAGFEAIDLKACHGYLLHELLFSAHPEFFFEVLDAIRDRVPGLEIAVRLGLHDGLGGDRIDLSQALRIIEQLLRRDCRLLNTSMGIPYKNPHVGRPFDRPLPGAEVPPEHPLAGVSRLQRGIGEAQKTYPQAVVVGTGYSWLRHLFPHVAAAVLSRGEARLIGLGRLAIAYPDLPRDLLEHGRLDPRKVCVTCSGCTELMRHGRPSGCVLRDRAVYGKIYQEIQTT